MRDPQGGEWRADFASAEERRRDASLAASVSERLRWLEEALAFAARMGALPWCDTPPDHKPPA